MLLNSSIAKHEMIEIRMRPRPHSKDMNGREMQSKADVSTYGADVTQIINDVVCRVKRIIVEAGSLRLACYQTWTRHNPIRS